MAGVTVMATCPWTVAASTATATQVSQETVSGLITVTGVVTDATGEPLIGASVFVKGKGTGIATDFDGRFFAVSPGRRLS